MSASVRPELVSVDEGHEVSTYVRLLERSAKCLHGVSLLVNHGTRRIASTAEFVEGHVDLGTRRTTPIAPVLADALDRILGEHRALLWTVALTQGRV